MSVQFRWWFNKVNLDDVSTVDDEKHYPHFWKNKESWGEGQT